MAMQQNRPDTEDPCFGRMNDPTAAASIKGLCGDEMEFYLVIRDDRIGMMKFGSRLDMYLPADSVEILAGPGDKVRAGETIIARIRREQP